MQTVGGFSGPLVAIAKINFLTAVTELSHHSNNDSN